MKILVKPIIASALILVSTGIYAEGYSTSTVKKIINSMDDNSDKKVGFEEYYEAVVTDNKDSLDTNNDGYVTAGEIVIEITEDLVETIKKMRAAGVSEANINKTIASELNTAEKEANALIRKMDTDGDFLVEPGEFKAHQHKLFLALDKNKDGVISNADVKKNKGFPIRVHDYTYN